MSLLRWSFDWPVRRAVAVTDHGTYVIEGAAPRVWSATFTRIDTEQFRRTARPVGRKPDEFTSMADAMRACQRHAEQFTGTSSDRLTIATPLP